MTFSVVGRGLTAMAVLAIDAGTTGVTALVVDETGSGGVPRLRGVPAALPAARLGGARAGADLAGHAVGVPPGAAQRLRPQRHRGRASPTSARRRCCGTGARSPPRAAPSSGRTAARPAICDRLREAGHEDRVRELTGLRFDPYFTGTKLTWLAENDPSAWAGVTAGDVVVGTVDSYLVARLTGGARHVTDASNASRTLLFDIGAGRVVGRALRAARRTAVGAARGRAVVRRGRPHLPGAFLGLDVPIAGIAGDQQAALFGQACFAEGESKCTYGTGSFVLVNTGATLERSDAGLLTTVAWMSPGRRADLRPGGRDLRHRRGRAVAARRRSG